MTLDTVKGFLRVDGDDENDLIMTMMADAEDYLTDNVGDHAAKLGNARYARKADSFKLLLIHDAYFNRALVTDASQRLSLKAQSILSQLQYGDYPVVTQ